MPLAAERRKKCSRSGGLRSARSVVIYFGVYPWILTSFIRSWHHIQPWQTQFAVLTLLRPPPPNPTTLLSSLFSSRALPECARKEVSQTDPLLMCSRERNLPFMIVPSSRAAVIRQGIGVWRFNTAVPAGRLSWRGAAGDTLWYVATLCSVKNTRLVSHSLVTSENQVQPDCDLQKSVWRNDTTKDTGWLRVLSTHCRLYKWCPLLRRWMTGQMGLFFCSVGCDNHSDFNFQLYIGRKWQNNTALKTQILSFQSYVTMSMQI